MLTRRLLLGSVFASLAAGEAPEVSSFDLSLLDEPAVPNELFFVREHFPAPQVSAVGWKLSVTGAVRKAIDFSLEDIATGPRTTLPVTLECAENAPGGGLVSHAEWTGIPLATLLEKAQPDSQSSFVRLTGADGFTRSIPIAKAMHPDSLIVYSMNGETLPPKHGSPLRAVFPGWYAMDSIKWLQGIKVLTEQDSAADANSYLRATRSLLTGARPSGPVTTMNVKSAFSRPVDGAILRGKKFTIRGAAWAGENRIRTVEVSTDKGATWNKASRSEQKTPYAWALWAFDWKIPGSGDYELAVRATDEKGAVQPPERAADRADGYELNMYQRIRVSVV